MQRTCGEAFRRTSGTKQAPTTTDAVDLGHEFPIPDEKGTLDLDPAPARFLRLKVE